MNHCWMILPQIPEIHIPTLTHKEPIVLLTKSMEALLAKSAKLQSVASTLNGEEDERQDFFWAHFFSELHAWNYKKWQPEVSSYWIDHFAQSGVYFEKRLWANGWSLRYLGHEHWPGWRMWKNPQKRFPAQNNQSHCTWPIPTSSYIPFS